MPFKKFVYLDCGWTPRTGHAGDACCLETPYVDLVIVTIKNVFIYSDETAADELANNNNNNSLRNRSLRSCSSAGGGGAVGGERESPSSSRWSSRLSAWCASCVDPDRPGDEDCSSGGYTTPR